MKLHLVSESLGLICCLMEKNIKHLERYFGAHEISVKNYLPPCSSGAGAGSCPSCSTWACCAWPQPDGGTAWQWDTEVLQTLPFLAGSVVTELRKDLTYLLLKKKKHDLPHNEHTAFCPESKQALLTGCAPLLLPSQPSREPAKPFHGGLNSMLSRSTSAPCPSRTAQSTGSFAIFILAFAICLPRYLLLLLLLPGDSSKAVVSFPQPRGVPQTLCVPGARCHRLTEPRFTPWSHVVSHFA